MIQIRDADYADVPEITCIYNDAVQNTTAIWNDTYVESAERAAWLRQRKEAGFPVFVAFCSETGDITGYASYGPWRAFDGYRYTVENSVYVHPLWQRRGVGRLLMQALIKRARETAVHVMVAGIEAENTASIALHKEFGFEDAGLVKEAGVKFGRWLDLALLALRLNEWPDPPCGRTR